METSYFENTGGRLVIKPMPVACQFSSVEAIAVIDVNNDGAPDVVMAGNSDTVQPDIGRADASYGAVALGDGRGGFTSVEPSVSGFVPKGQARAIATVLNSRSAPLIIVTRNNDRPLVYTLPDARSRR
jgi:enediyne biosynthesis protein E4